MLLDYMVVMYALQLECQCQTDKTIREDNFIKLKGSKAPTYNFDGSET